MKNKIILTLPITTLLATSHQGAKAENNNKQPNVLFICVDDLRDELGCYGSKVKSPNLDKLANDGTLFKNHYVAVPTSGASRASLLSGLYPTEKQHLKNDACDYRFADKAEGKNPETLFHALKRDGYYNVGIGKVSHSKDGSAYKNQSEKLQLPYSWDEMIVDCGRWDNAFDASLGYGDGSTRDPNGIGGIPYECVDTDDDCALIDGLSAQLALQKIEGFAKEQEDKPFCLAVGFMRPHLPFVSPKKYWDMYNREDIDLPEYEIPENLPNNKGLSNSGEFNNQYKAGEESVSLTKKASDEYTRKLRHAYYASVSYVDAQVGKIINKLKELDLYDNTVIIVWGDHGWHLGEMNVWGKHTNFEPSLKSTLIVKAPNIKGGNVTNKIVSSIDIYPTIMELCDVNINYSLDGKSFKQLLQKPNDKSWNNVAYSYWGSSVSVRTDKYRLTEYKLPNQQRFLFEFHKNRYETKNVADTKPEIVEQLLPTLLSGDKIAY